MLNLELYEARRGQPFTEKERAVAKGISACTDFLERAVLLRRVLLEQILSGASAESISKTRIELDAILPDVSFALQQEQDVAKQLGSVLDGMSRKE